MPNKPYYAKKNWKDDPATPGQVKFLKAKGVDAVAMTKGEASDKISTIKSLPPKKEAVGLVKHIDFSDMETKILGMMMDPQIVSTVHDEIVLDVDEAAEYPYPKVKVKWSDSLKAIPLHIPTGLGKSSYAMHVMAEKYGILSDTGYDQKSHDYSIKVPVPYSKVSASPFPGDSLDVIDTSPQAVDVTFTGPSHKARDIGRLSTDAVNYIEDYLHYNPHRVGTVNSDGPTLTMMAGFAHKKLMETATTFKREMEYLRHSHQEQITALYRKMNELNEELIAAREAARIKVEPVPACEGRMFRDDH